MATYYVNPTTGARCATLQEAVSGYGGAQGVVQGGYAGAYAAPQMLSTVQSQPRLLQASSVNLGSQNIIRSFVSQPATFVEAQAPLEGSTATLDKLGEVVSAAEAAALRARIAELEKSIAEQTAPEAVDSGIPAAESEEPAAPPPEQTVLGFDQLQKAENAIYNPEWIPGGDEGGVDTNTLPWIDLPQIPGALMKPLRVGKESGSFTILIKLKQGLVMPTHVNMGAQDIYILSGELQYSQGPLAQGPSQGKVTPGMWGYIPALARMEGAKANKDTEFLSTYYAPVAFFDALGKPSTLLTAVDVQAAAQKANITLLPCTLKDALTDNKKLAPGKADANNLSPEDYVALCSRADAVPSDKLSNPHFVDTNELPWIGDPPIQLKVVRVSAETGAVALIVKQNGQAPPHYHLGPADFFITQGRIGYRAGPPEGYGPGTYMYEPAGARHESTQPVETDLVYTANVYGPIQFDSGVGTPVVMVLSWMTYLQMAQAANSPLLASNFPDDSCLIAPSI